MQGALVPANARRAVNRWSAASNNPILYITERAAEADDALADGRPRLQSTSVSSKQLPAQHTLVQRALF